MTPSPPNIGDILCATGLIDREQLARALRTQCQRPGDRLGTILVDMGACDRHELASALAKQFEMRKGEVPSLADTKALADYAAELLENA